jgi:VWFA-related protein
MRFVLAPTLLLALTTAAPAQDTAPAYLIDFDPHHINSSQQHPGNKGVHVNLTFKLLRAGDNSIATDVPAVDIVVLEDGKPVEDLTIVTPQVKELTTVLAIDVSGSMATNNKMQAARLGASVFLDRLDPTTSNGLILFDHEVPLGDPSRVRRPSHDREAVRKLIAAAQPRGGTAYIDATAEAVKMLADVEGNRAVVLMTDGVDMNSTQSLDQVVAAARKASVPVYTLGIGEPGKIQMVTTVLVLDQSGSMAEKADDGDRRSKMDALKVAASRFVDLMRSQARTTLLPFTDVIETPKPFSDNKGSLKAQIAGLKPLRGTLLYDATFTGLETLIAQQILTDRTGDGAKERLSHGKQAVVVLTDGVDEAPGSRMSDQDVIDRAKQAKIPIYLLGLGPAREINEKVMKRMADETGGKYYHVRNEQDLITTFENLSIMLHDDGIDEASLRRLGEATGGGYHHVKDISDLSHIYEQLADELQTAYRVSFRSPRDILDGTKRDITIQVVRGGRTVSNIVRGGYTTRGVVPAQMDHRVYLALLAVLGLLLWLPTGLRRMTRRAGRVNAPKEESGR